MLLKSLLICTALVHAYAIEHAESILGWSACEHGFHLNHRGRCTREHPVEFTIQTTHDDLENIASESQGKLSVPPLEVVPLLISGPSDNRVDFVFFSDGYVLEEREKFVADALRLAEDVTKNQTFYTVQPLLNFWAAFSPSKESGIGVGGTPKDTPFGLYRDGTELRGVYYEHPEVGKAACESMGEQCDYPILLGNDPLYGGLGGQFTVITASVLNGPLVLRHELGHSILDVGEEYDGGSGYFGRNAAHDIHSVPWKQWFSDPSRIDIQTGGPHVERSVMALQAYPWTLLNTTQPWVIDFTSSGAYSRYSLQFSLSGLPKKQDLRVTLDDIDLGWAPRPDIGMDRWFYNFQFSEPLTPGRHQLKFTLLSAARQGSAQLCSTEILEYGTEEQFISKPGFYGLYPTYSDKNETTFRPTNEDCLMRAVSTPNFCKVCVETLWLHLLKGVSLVDSIDESCEKSQAAVSKVLSLKLLPLASLRKMPVIPKEAYSITWKKDGDLLSDFTNETSIHIGDATGEYTVHVKFFTEEIRMNTSRTETYTSHVVKDVMRFGYQLRLQSFIIGREDEKLK